MLGLSHCRVIRFLFYQFKGSYYPNHINYVTNFSFGVRIVLNKVFPVGVLESGRGGYLKS